MRITSAVLASLAGCVGSSSNETREHTRLSQPVIISNTHTIEGYADKLDAAPGDTIQFSVHSPNSSYSVSIYKYGSDSGPQLLAGSYSCSNGMVRDYTDTAYQDGAGWPVSFSLSVPNSGGSLGLTNCTGSSSVSKWASGVYVARLQTASNPDFDVTFVVRDSTSDQKDILLLASTNTWNAYNFWPQDSGFYTSPWTSITGANFKRPNPYATPEVHDTLTGYWQFDRTEHLAAGEVRLARWFQRNGHPYSMTTDLDVNNSWSATTKTSVLDSFKTVVINTHSEYWSDNMYRAFTSYLARGGSVVSISGNTAYRRVLIDDSTKKMTKANPESAAAGWDTFTSSPASGWTDFIPKKQLFGFQFTGGSTSACNAFIPTAAAISGANKLAHWSFTGIAGASLGSTGEIASPSTRCSGGTSGASGEETDVATPTFAREFTVLGSRADNYGSSILHMRRASAGQIFSIGSITAGGSFATGDTNLTTLLENVLDRTTAHRSFSDFGSDGLTDVIGLSTVDSKLWLMQGTSSAGISFPSAGFDAGWNMFNRIVAPGDLDSDASPDLIARKPDGTLLAYRGTGSGTLVQTAGATIATGWNVYTDIITPGDFDGDGRPDVLGWKNDGTLILHRGDGSGGFVGSGQQIDSGWNMFVEIMSPGDLDEDGIPDLLARKSDGTVKFYRGYGNGTINQATPATAATGWNVYDHLLAGGDFDRDGHADVLAVNSSGTMYLLKGNGNGTFASASQLGSTGAFSQFTSLFTVW